MYRQTRLLCFLIALLAASPTSHAQDAGQAKLDEATEKKLDAQSPADLGKVIELCEQAIEGGLDDVNLRLANQMLAASALQRAQMLLQSLPRIANNPNAVRNLRSQMMSDLEKAVGSNPELSEAWILMAKLETLPGGSRERALEDINKAIESLKDKPVDQANAYILRAGLQADNEDKLKDLTKAIEVDSTNSDAWQAKVALQLALGKLEEVVNDTEQMLEQDENNMFAFEAAIRSLLGLSKLDEAHALLTKRIEKDPKNGDFYRWRGRVSLMQENDEAALEDLNKAIELNNRDFESLVMRGQIYYTQGEIEKANRDISDSLLIEPDSVQGVLMRSLVAAEEKRYADAITDMEMLVRADPNNTQWILQLASYYQMDERPRLAIRVLDKLLEQDPNNWRAMRLRGDSKLSISEHADAVEDYRQAVTMIEKSREVADEDKGSDVDYSGLLNNLSWVLSTSPKQELRNGKEALDLALKACEATEYKASHILSTLAAAYAETGDFEKAREWSAKAVELAEEESNEQIDQLKEELESYKQDKPWREEQKTEENDKPLSSATEAIDT